MMRHDPCLTCHLPDCDDESPSCPLRRAASLYSSAKRRGQAAGDLPDHIRSGYNAWYLMYEVERDARRSEQTGGGHP